LTNAEAKVAQSVEHSTENAGVGGSIPPLGTTPLIARALSQMRSGLRLLILTRFFLLTAKLPAKVKYPLYITRDLVQEWLPATKQGVTLLAISTFL
jgi:hypothetical protein